MKKVYYKKDIMLKEEDMSDKVLDADLKPGETQQQAVNRTLQGTPQKTASLSMADMTGQNSGGKTINLGEPTAQNIQAGKNIANALKGTKDAQGTEFEFTKESKENNSKILEGITFTKGELSDFLRSI